MTNTDDRTPELAVPAADRFGRSIGPRLVHVTAGRAVLELIVRPDHLNDLGRMHGGALFALGDIAMALAANQGPDVAVTMGAHVTFLCAVGNGDCLVADAREVHSTGRRRIYRTRIARDDELVAVVDGEMRTAGRPTAAARFSSD